MDRLTLVGGMPVVRPGRRKDALAHLELAGESAPNVIPLGNLGEVAPGGKGTGRAPAQRLKILELIGTLAEPGTPWQSRHRILARRRGLIRRRWINGRRIDRRRRLDVRQFLVKPLNLGELAVEQHGVGLHMLAYRLRLVDQRLDGIGGGGFE